MENEVDIFSLPIEMDETHERGNASICVDKIKCHPDDYELLVTGLNGLRGKINENHGVAGSSSEDSETKE